MTNIFVGNLSYQTTQDDLHAAFAAYGSVERVNVISDRDTGQPRGFAFVEMANDDEAQQAIEKFNNYQMGGRNLTVNEARPKERFGGGGGGGGFGGGGGGGQRRREPRW